MNWFYGYHLLLALHSIHNACAFKGAAMTVETGLSDKMPTDEVPKPIEPMLFEELDSDYIRPRKLTLRVWKTAKSSKPSIVDIALQIAAKEGIEAMTDLYQNIEPEIARKGQLLDENHPATLLSRFSAPVEGTERSAMAAYATITATKAFRRNYKESTVLGRQAQAQKLSFRRTPLEGLCPPREPPTCTPASQRYRTHDGTCNNRRRPRWGSAQMPFNRFLPPEYGDGVDSIRGSVEGGPLSSARFVSLLVHGAREGDAPLTLMIVQWGQLLDHDLTSTAQPRSINGSVPSCCGSKDFHPSCFPIKVPLDDPWLAPLKVRCLEFLRSAPAQRRDCVLSWREQTNQVTSYVDASPIYSSNAKTSDNARIFRNGLLVYGRGNAAEDVCMRGAIAHQCIRSGDGRSGEQPGLLALHHVWVGEHNRIALELSNLNPHWSDEKVYQETRRIIGALFQHITYREFLPIVLGREVCKLFDLELLTSGYYTSYDPNTNPTVANSFAAAAFRFGHSLVQNSYMRCDRHHKFINNNVTLHEEFQHGDIGTAGSLHRLLRGLAAQKALKRDEFITPELTNHLFQTPGFPFGLDLAAINIQRGRDHGIAPYTAWRQPCGLSPINSWEDLSNVVGPESAKRISHAYRNVHDIDLFVGGIAERPVIGGLVGPTFACIIAQQFSNSRKGDRFWYENPGFESSFTPAQLHSIRHVSFASVLCRVIGSGTLQPHVFIPSDVAGNQRVECGTEALAPIDLRPWQEQDPFLETTEKVANPISQSTALPTPLPLQIIKEEKGVNNRIHNITVVTHVDFIPNGSIGFHRIPNMTKIHDKLDMAQKIVTRPLQKPLEGISNKLDKGRIPTKKRPKPLVALLGKRHNSTTRRTVVIHNVEIELRSSPAKTNKKKKKKTNRDSQKNAGPHNLSVKVSGLLRSPLNSAIQAEDDRDDVSKEIPTQTFETDILDYTTSETPTDKPTDFPIDAVTDTPTEALSEPTTTQSTQNYKDTTDLFVFDIDFPSTLRTPSSDKSNESYNDFQTVINSALHVPSDEHVRVHRSPALNHFQVHGVELSTHLNFLDKLRTLKLDKTNAFSGRDLSDPVFELSVDHFELQNATDFYTNLNDTTTDDEEATDDPLESLRNLDIRQFHERPIYNRPQKVVVDGPNADQYEIEINIRQTKPNQPIPNDKYQIAQSPNQRYDPDRYAETFQSPYYRPQTQSTPYYTQSTSAPYVSRTKPPTVIYLNEHDETMTTTTRAPGFFQNILSFATNGFNGNKQQTPPPSGPFTYIPNRVPSSAVSSDLPYQPNSSKYQTSPPSKPTSSNYVSAAQVHPYPPQQGFPPPVGPVGGLPPQQPYPLPDHSGANSFSTSSNLGGVSHASSSAVSTGHFGAIVGSASSSSSDSTFSFNIRPSSRPQPNLVSPTGIRPNYELIPPYRPQYQSTPSYAVPPKPISSVESFHYPPNRQDPFSGHTPRPPYYHNRPSNVYDPAYDDLGRSELKPDDRDTKTNGTKDDDELDSSDYDYNDDDDESNINGPNNDVDDDDEPAKKFDKDGYLRPEHMAAHLYQQTLLNKTTTLNTTNLDDNFVLPVLRQDDEFAKTRLTDATPGSTMINVTAFPTIEQKSLTNDIMAEDYDDLLPAGMSFLTARAANRGEKRRRPAINLQVAFAPIKVLTKPERPDNWVMFDTPEEKPLLPVLPAYNGETQAAAEVPLPIDEYRVAAIPEMTDMEGRTSPDSDEDEQTTIQLDEDETTQNEQGHDTPTTTEATTELDLTTTNDLNVTEDTTTRPIEDVTDNITTDQITNQTDEQTDSTTDAFTITDSPKDVDLP